MEGKILGLAHIGLFIGDISHTKAFCSRCYPNGAKWILFHGPDGERLEITEVL